MGSTVFKFLKHFTDYNLIQELLTFHNKSTVLIDPKITCHFKPNISGQVLESLTNTDIEINPFHLHDIPCKTHTSAHLKRNRSADSFINKQIDFQVVESLLNESFAMQDDGSRPYPSGGALYPVEVFCVLFQERLLQSPVSGVYHYRPSLQVLQEICTITSTQLHEGLHLDLSITIGSPNFCILYLVNIEKTLIKYRLRGYRYALIESGAMCHQADLVGKSLGLKNRLYSSFDDFELMSLLNLNKMSFLPIVIQMFGS